jgi:hypothetical protein
VVVMVLLVGMVVVLRGSGIADWTAGTNILGQQ